MINETLYNKTVDILVQAYFNDTLRHGDCAMCAIGNIIAGNLGALAVDSHNPVFLKDGKLIGVAWDGYHPNGLCNEKRSVFDVTGYSDDHVLDIEDAFESVYTGNSKDERMFNGLMSVIDALDIIHENTDRHVTTVNKNKFVKI